MWVQDYKGIAGDERADALGREVSADAFTGPELTSGITKVTAYDFVSNWVKRQP